MSSVGEDFPKEQQRVRELVAIYREQHNTTAADCTFAIAMLEQALTRAELAAASGDVIEILRSYAELRGCE